MALEHLDTREFKFLEIKKRENGIVVLFSSLEEAVHLVKKFWEAMPHARDLALPDGKNGILWTDDLTMGDRTKIIKGVSPENRGKWLVSIEGNHQDLTKDAKTWLIQKGLLTQK